MPGLRFSALRFALLVCGVALAVRGQVLLPPNDFRISDMGIDGQVAPIALIPAVAYNATNHEYLVVWYGDEGGAGAGEIYGQRISAATGAEVGTNDFRISDMGPDDSLDYAASRFDVVWNATANEYLVVWRGDDDTGTLVDDEFEIFGQRISGATGAQVGTNDFRISSMETDGLIDAAADMPAVTWSATNNEYLVVWHGHDGDGEFEIRGQRLSSAGAEVGTDDFRISDAGVDGDAVRMAVDPRVAWNSVGNEYLVVWVANDLSTANEVEVFGQRLNATTGAEVGTNDFRISDMGVDGTSADPAQGAVVAYDPAGNEYLVVFYGTDSGFTGVEIIGQRIDGTTGAEVGANDFLISDAGSDALFNVSSPSVEYSVALGAFLIVWQGDDDQGSTVDDEFEIWGQLIEGGTGSAIGTNDFRISDAGPDGDANYSAGNPSLAFDANGVALVAWRADDDIPPLVNSENEIFGQRVSMAAATEDFTGDGLNDILWRQPSTGKNVFWEMSGTSRLGYGSLLDVPGTSWSIGGTGDFSGDGKPDILWRNSATGQNVVWMMNGTTRSSYVTLLSVPGSDWEVGGVDDFDGDGDADIVWRNGSTGQNVLWTMSGTARTSYTSLLAVTGPEWRMVAVGDVTGDGKADIVWRNGSTGQNVLWAMNGATRTSYTTMLSVPESAWRIMATADYDGDADADLLWRNVSSGQNVVWFMNGAIRTSYGSLMTVSDLSWEIQGPR